MGAIRASRFQTAFGALVLGQAAHSIEEYVGRLWESFPPARFLTSLESQDLELGFIVINASLVAFGFWCFLWPVRRQWPVARGLALLWIGIELINGLGHPLWSLRQRSYTPGLITAPVPLVLADLLAAPITAADADHHRPAHMAREAARRLTTPGVAVGRPPARRGGPRWRRPRQGFCSQWERRRGRRILRISPDRRPSCGSQSSWRHLS